MQAAVWRTGRPQPLLWNTYVRWCSGAAAEAAAEGTRPRRRLPKGHWHVRENRVRFFEQLGAALGVREDADWARVTVRDVERHGGGGLLRIHEHSLVRALEATYPGRAFSSGSARAKWATAEARRAFLDKAAAELAVRAPKDWRRVTSPQVAALGGGGLLRRFRGSLAAALRDAYPEIAAAPATLVRKSVGRGHWQDRAARAALLEGVRRSLPVRAPEDWERAGPAIRAAGGARLLEMYASVTEMLRATFPDEEVPDGLVLRGRLPNGHWDVRENRRRFMDEVAARHGVREPQDWRKVSTRDVEAVRGGSAVLRRYRSLYAALADLYPEHGALLQPHLLRSVAPRHHWKSAKNVRTFVEEAGRQLGVRRLDDWYRVGREQVRGLPGGGVVSSLPLPELLRMAYPDHRWDVAQFAGQGKRSSQRLLLTHVGRIFPAIAVPQQESERM